MNKLNTRVNYIQKENLTTFENNKKDRKGLIKSLQIKWPLLTFNAIHLIKDSLRYLVVTKRPKKDVQASLD